MKTINYNNYISGERVYLRDVNVNDATEKYLHWLNDPEINQYLESRFRINSLESLKDYISSINKDINTYFFAIVEKEKDTHIGNIKLGNVNWIHRFCDLGIILGDKDFWGKGYATEAIKILCEYGFNILNLNKITCGIYSCNIGSIKCFEKVGFKKEGTKVKNYFYKGEYIDSYDYGLFKEDLRI